MLAFKICVHLRLSVVHCITMRMILATWRVFEQLGGYLVALRIRGICLQLNEKDN